MDIKPKPGTRVRLVAPYSPFHNEPAMPAGTTGTVLEHYEASRYVRVSFDYTFAKTKNQEYAQKAGLLMHPEELEVLENVQSMEGGQ